MKSYLALVLTAIFALSALPSNAEAREYRHHRDSDRHYRSYHHHRPYHRVYHRGHYEYRRHHRIWVPARYVTVYF